ncbi:hypothetical protein J4407_01470 [Candidatus Pacearchaeota archaeon]|nr:hypothetical protein [Candidatus Pacearchaeota archaeon]
MEVILDTNFIMTCVKQKIDFFSDIETLGFKIIIPKQVLNELKLVIRSRKKHHFRQDAELSLKIIESEKGNWKTVDLKKYGKNTDTGIKNFAEVHERVLVATMDQELKRKIKNNKIVIRGMRKLDVVK